MTAGHVILPPAQVCHKLITTQLGAGPAYYVRAPDGYLLDCGDSLRRAVAVERAINAALNPDRPWPPPANELPF